ncbi:MAG: hypothetical protein AAGI01_09795 [Myxococcota bacterium]
MQKWRASILGIVCTVVIALPAAAQAQDLRKPSLRLNVPSFAGPSYIVPSFAATFGWSSTTTHEPGGVALVEQQEVWSFWLGVNLHPSATPLSLYGSAGLEIEPTVLSDGRSAVYFMPSVRAGAAVIKCGQDDIGYSNVMFPCASVYAIGGVRPPSLDRSWAARVGVGVSSPWVTLAGAYGGILLPGILEFVSEHGPDGHTQAIVRFGVGW